MRADIFLAGLIGASLTAVSAVAQDGQYGDALKRMLDEAAAGQCSTELMGEQLLAACNQQIAAMSAGLKSLGAVESLTFVRSEEGPQGRVETYQVKFAGGQMMNWFIGGMNEGKFETAGSQG